MLFLCDAESYWHHAPSLYCIIIEKSSNFDIVSPIVYSVDSFRRRADSLPTTNQEWKVVVKPGKLVKLGPLMSMNKLLEGLASVDGHDSEEAESENEEEWFLNELFDETQANDDEWYLNELFGESEVDVREVEKIIIKKTKNTLFERYAEDYNRKYQNSPEKKYCETPNK